MKVIRNSYGAIFLIRFSFRLKSGGSIKIHLFLNDDNGAHSHPWNFVSLVLFGGYKELSGDDKLLNTEKVYGWLSVNRKEADVYHFVQLRRFLGVRIPTLTIGKYEKKKQLCSLCKDLGYCKSQANKVKFKSPKHYDGPKISGYAIHDELGMTAGVDHHTGWKITKPAMSQGDVKFPIPKFKFEGENRPGYESFMEMADEFFIIHRSRGKRVIISDTDECEPIYDII